MRLDPAAAGPPVGEQMRGLMPERTFHFPRANSSQLWIQIDPPGAWLSRPGRGPHPRIPADMHCPRQRGSSQDDQPGPHLSRQQRIGICSGHAFQPGVETVGAAAAGEADLART